VKVIHQQTEFGVKLEKALSDAAGNRKFVSVGFHKDAKYDNGTQVATVAAVQEFGYPEKNIPARPFMRPTITKKMASWKSLMQTLAKKVIAGEITVDDALISIGARSAENFREAIKEIKTPPIAESTRRARERKRNLKKGSLSETGAKPLVDSGIMIGAMTSKLETR